MIRDTSAWLAFFWCTASTIPFSTGSTINVWHWFWPQTHCQDLWNELCNSFKSDRTMPLTSVWLYQTHFISLYYFVLGQRNFWQKPLFHSKFQRQLFTDPLESFISVLMLSAVFCLQFYLSDTGSLELFPTKLETTVIPTFFLPAKINSNQIMSQTPYSFPPKITRHFDHVWGNFVTFLCILMTWCF